MEILRSLGRQSGSIDAERTIAGERPPYRGVIESQIVTGGALDLGTRVVVRGARGALLADVTEDVLACKDQRPKGN